MASTQQVVGKVTVIATTLVLGSFSVMSAQAATVTGSVSGTWTQTFGSSLGGLKPGDAFTAVYSYDDTQFIPEAGGQTSIFSAPLLSLVVNSGSYQHAFQFLSNDYGRVYSSNSPGSLGNSLKSFAIFGYDILSSNYNFFGAGKQVGQSNGTPFSDSFANLLTGNPFSGSIGAGLLANSNLTFTPDPLATAIPTPALLPGLVGLGLGVLRKRKAAAQ